MNNKSNREEERKSRRQSRKEARERILRERKLNASMMPLAKRNREQLGMLAVQPEKNVFSLAGQKFAKIYSLKGVGLTDTRKRMLIGELCRLSSNRMRLSTFSYANGNAPLIFLTVFFTGDSYADVADEIDGFDKSLSSLMDSKLTMSFAACGIGDIFMFIYMNFNGQMKKASAKAVTKKSAHLKKDYFQEVKEREEGYCIPKTEKVGKSYVCIQYPDRLDASMNVLRRLACTYLCCADFQVVGEEYASYYNRMIEEGYGNGGVAENMAGLMFNLSFMFSYLCDNEAGRNACDTAIKDFFAKCGLTAAPCIGAEEKVLESISTFGLIDLHCCRKASMEVVSHLFG